MEGGRPRRSLRPDHPDASPALPPRRGPSPARPSSPRAASQKGSRFEGFDAASRRLEVRRLLRRRVREAAHGANPEREPGPT